MQSFILFIVIVFALITTAILFFAIGKIIFGSRTFLQKFSTKPILNRRQENPILEPACTNVWEADAVFNPAALYDNNEVHLLYRALGPEGISRIGYAKGNDGICFPFRLPYPVYTFAPKHKQFSRDRLRYNPQLYASGGGWGGCEDPRIVKIENRIFMTFSAFEGWHSMRIGMTHISVEDFRKQRWNWSPAIYISPADRTHKNWVLFPEKINGKYTLLTGITPHIQIEQYNTIDDFERRAASIQSIYMQKSGGISSWEETVRGAGPPPIKTDSGWLLFYHGHDKENPDKYKLGAILLDIDDPRKVLYRSKKPLLSPDEWYENEGKPGVVYASGAIVKDGELFIYYGGGDRVTCTAHAPLADILKKLACNKNKIFISEPLTTR